MGLIRNLSLICAAAIVLLLKALRGGSDTMFSVGHHQNDHGLDAEWHFFATSHGKSPCDGIGGTVKCLVARASLQATVKDHILTATQMYNWASEHIPGVKFFFVSDNDVADNAARFELTSRFDSVKTLSGTRSHHCFIPVSEVELKVKRISANSDFTMGTLGEKQPSSLHSILPDSQHHDQLQPGKYVACMYDKEWYVGSIVERSDEQSDALVDCMKRSSKGFLSWPSVSRKDQCWLPFQHIICLIGAPELQGHSARYYKLPAQDYMQIQQKLPAFL